MALAAYISFCFKNYLRQHRYLLDLVAMVIFSIILGGFLNGTHQDDNLWWMVLSGFAVFLNISTAPAMFFLEHGNTLHFLLSKPNGRRNLLLSKIIVIVLVDLFWIFLFSMLYGLRFL
jgi:ABC-type transport system involved in multi-copper enzyme maturation permease subunit